MLFRSWEDCGEVGNGYVFAWCREYLEVPGRFVRVTALDGSVTVSEMAIAPAGSDGIPELKATGKHIAVPNLAAVLPGDPVLA